MNAQKIKSPDFGIKFIVCILLSPIVVTLLPILFIDHNIDIKLRLIFGLSFALVLLICLYLYLGVQFLQFYYQTQLEVVLIKEQSKQNSLAIQLLEQPRQKEEPEATSKNGKTKPQ